MQTRTIKLNGVWKNKELEVEWMGEESMMIIIQRKDEETHMFNDFLSIQIRV